MLEKKNMSLREEMSQVSIGSFYLSPDERDGHRRVIRLYCSFRKNELKEVTLDSVFGVSKPLAPIATLPERHKPFNPTGLSTQIWNELLEAAFSNGAEYLNERLEIRDLLKLNARIDQANFEARMRDEKSKVIPGARPHPSLLRSFLFEGHFPYKDNEFFIWLLSQMANEFIRIADSGFKEAVEVRNLVLMWDAHFPNESFIPLKFTNV